MNQGSGPVCSDDIFQCATFAWRRGRKGVTQRCDGGIMEFFTGQRRTIDLSAGSLCPPLTRHNIHTRQQSIRPGFLEAELRVAAPSGCCSVSPFPSVFLLTREARAPGLGRISQCRQMSSSQKRCRHIKLPATFKASLANNFLLISNSPAYRALLIIPDFICILQY